MAAPPIDARVAQYLRKLSDRQQQLEQLANKAIDKYEEFVKACSEMPRSITAEIDAIPGRRIFYNLVGTVDFTVQQQGTRGTPVTFLISQDGPFIATHYPEVIWKPIAPINADNFGRWSPVSSWPLPTQQITNQDIIDLSYEVVDSGSQRNFQNSAAPPIFSRPDDIVPLPVPTLFAPNTTIQFFPTYERIFFDAAVEVPTTAGRLVVAFPGYRIVNM